MTTIIIIGFIQALFFAVLAMAKRQKETADYILTALFVVIAYQLGVNYVMLTGYKYQLPHLIGTAGPLVFLYGPLLFFFIRYYISGRQKLRSRHFLHFLPFVADQIHNLFYLYLLTGTEKITILNELLAGKPDAELSTVILLRAVSPFIYSVWSVIVLRKHRKNILYLYSFSSDSLKLEWLWNLAWSMFWVSSIALILNFVIVFSDVVDWIHLREIILVISVIWVFFIGYYSVRKTPFYRSFPIAGLENFDTVEADRALTEKYEKTKLNEAEVRNLRRKLMDYMENEKPYLNKNLTIGELAGMLDVPVHHLSQVINSNLGMTFFEFINRYRVEEVKARFMDPEYSNLTLPGIAMTCGFNSKSSFNRAFKQFTGQTPSEYLKKKEVA